ncbi:MAG: 1-acyl-sn-glycerol-3-phosphate acyltransferase [Clostridia bacterium]|nr:1-acyl-sn-glycerol-3-phosphate acyltransferase [Clostridia bacterium]
MKSSGGESRSGAAGSEKRDPLFSFRYLIYDIIRLTAVIPGLIWFRPRRIFARGKKPDLSGGLLIIANHIGFFDPVYLMMMFPGRRIKFVCRREFWNTRHSAFWFRSFLTIPVDRDNFGMDSFREITSRLRAGSAVGLFPEGHIDTEGDPIGSFKSGMVLMALRSGAPVLPVLLTKRKNIFERLTAVIGEPVRLDTGGGLPPLSKIDELSEMLKDRVRELCSYLPVRKRDGATGGGRPE